MLCSPSCAAGETESFAWPYISSPTTALIDIYDIDIEVSVSVGGECDALSVGRPRRSPVLGPVVYESGLVFSVGIHHIDIPIVSVAVGVECDALSVGATKTDARHRQGGL